MDGHVGVVSRIEQNRAIIHFLRGAQCAHCGACLTAGESEMELAIENTLGAVVGDRVVVEVAPGKIAQASLVAYAVPLLLLIGGVLIGSRYQDWLGLVAGVVACGVGYLVIRLIDRAAKKRRTFEPRMTRKLRPGEEEESETACDLRQA